MRGTILGAIEGVAGGVILPRATNAAAPVWSIAGTTQVTEEAASAVYTVSYVNALSAGQSATIAIASAAGTAADGADYTGAATTLTFTAGGATAKTLAVTIIEDTTVEDPEDFRVTIGGASIGSFAASQVNTIIVDDDVVAPTFLLDAVSGTAVQAFSTRKLRAAFAGAGIRLRRSSDNAESDFGFDGAGNLDTAAIASWLGGATGFVTTWYDQSGNGRNATQSNGTLQPEFVASQINGRPALDFVPNDRMVMTRPTSAATWTTFAVVQKDSTASAHIISDNTQNRQHCVDPVVGAIRLYAGTVMEFSISESTTIPHLYEWENRGSNVGQIWIDGDSKGTGNPGAGTLGCDEIGSLTGGSSFYDGKIAEIIVFNPNLSSGDRVVIEASGMAYWNL